MSIFFDDISSGESESFVVFLNKLRWELDALDLELKLTISLPTISDVNKLNKVEEVYDFMKLNSIVHSYLIFTDELVRLNSNKIESDYFLVNEKELSLDVLASTISFYSNGKIPVSKLIVMVSMREDEQRLNRKYEWIKKNNLGGISILKFNK